MNLSDKLNTFSNEIVFRGHPDKVCDQIGDRILDEYLKNNPNTRAGIEVTGGKGVIFITGEVSSSYKIDDLTSIIDEVLLDVGYKNNYRVINNIGSQSPDIAQGVDIGGAGDQGMMFGYACNDNTRYIPDAMLILQEFSECYHRLTKENNIFLPDGKAMITGIYQGRKMVGVDTFLVSYQIKEYNRKKYNTDEYIKEKIKDILNLHGYTIEDDRILINPTGKFEIGGFDGDAGVLGRKIVVDAYHGFYHVGGGAQSGKDGTKVDRSGFYKARQIAKRYCELGLEWCEVQLSYAIGIEEPMSIMINSDIGIIQPDNNLFDECKPKNIIKDLNLTEPQFYETSKYGHVGRGFKWDK